MIEREQVMAILHPLDELGYTAGAMSADNTDAMRREIVALQRSQDVETIRSTPNILTRHVGAVVALGKKGSVLLFKGPLWHTARPNISATFRSAIMVTYVRSFCIPHTDMRERLAKVVGPTEIERRLLCGRQLQSRRDGRHQQGNAP